MIVYSSQRPWTFARWRGSVAPKALRWAIPCSLISVLFSKVIHDWTSLADFIELPTSSETTSWGLFTSILGFLIVFRAQLSYARYWEGITLIEQACGVWLNGFSNLIAFCSTSADKQDQVDEFQFLLSRLMSLLFCYSMCDISNLDRSRFPHLSLDELEQNSLAYLESTSAKQYFVLQWIQKMVVEGQRKGILDVAPPILSRVFQELSIGIVHFIDARKISAVPFPFEFAQMVWVMLVFFSTLPVPIICAVGMNITKAAAFTFLIVFVFWSVHHIAVEIELPFGDDPNDLPLDSVNHRFNKVLSRLLESKAQTPPTLMAKPDMDEMHFMKRESTVESSYALEGCDRRAHAAGARHGSVHLVNSLLLGTMDTKVRQTSSGSPDLVADGAVSPPKMQQPPAAPVTSPASSDPCASDAVAAAAAAAAACHTIPGGNGPEVWAAPMPAALDAPSPRPSHAATRLSTARRSSNLCEASEQGLPERMPMVGGVSQEPHPPPTSPCQQQTQQKHQQQSAPPQQLRLPAQQACEAARDASWLQIPKEQTEKQPQEQQLPLPRPRALPQQPRAPRALLEVKRQPQPKQQQQQQQQQQPPPPFNQKRTALATRPAECFGGMNCGSYVLKLNVQ